MLLSPAILWGILISDCNEDEDGSLDVAITDSGIQELSRATTAQSDDYAEIQLSKICPAILWGILLSETLAKAAKDESSDLPETEQELDMCAIIALWTAAGYDCQQAKEDNTATPIVTDSVLIGDGESTYSPPEPDGPYIVKESPGKGQGVFAARDVIRGERILVDKPFFVVTKPYNERKVLTIYERMPFANRQQYMKLYCPNRTDNINMTDVMRTFEANCFNIGDRAAVFLTATRFNHSCLPNTYYSWSDKRGEIVFHSMIDIPKDEEMTICYGRPLCTRLQRESQLRIYNFRCTCPACQSTTPFGQASESRRLTMTALEEQIIAFQSSLNKALLLYGLQDPLTPVLRLIETIKEEELHGELMTPYRDAADYLKGRGNFEEALEFAHLELEEEVVCLGNDSEVVIKTIEYIEELEVAMGEELDEEKSEVELEIDLGEDLRGESAEPGVDKQGLEKVSGPDFCEEKVSRNLDEDTSIHENQTDSQPKQSDTTRIQQDQEPEETPEQKPATPNPSNHEPESELFEAESDEDSLPFEEYPTELPSDSRSSSPRLVRKKMP